MLSKTGKRALGLSLIVAPAMANSQGVMFFDDQNAFRSMAAAHGKFLKGIEDFEESSLAPAGVAALNDPLVAGVANGPFLNGITGLSNLRIQSNTGGANSSQVAPAGANGLATASAGFGGIVTSDIVVSNTFVNGLDLIFDSNKTAVGGNPISVFSAGSIRVDVYDTFNNLIGTTNTFGTNGGTTFFGVVSNVAIGRINLWGNEPGVSQAEGLDNIEAWEVVPEPASMVALSLGALALMKRRRKS